MNSTYRFSLLFLSSVSLTSCMQEKTSTPLAQTDTIIYLQNVVTKTDNAITKFNSIVAQGNVIVDFYADWCGPCKIMSGVISQLTSQFPHVTFLKINTDMFPALSSTIRTIPTIIFYKNGQQIHRQSGALTSQQLRALIQKLF